MITWFHFGQCSQIDLNVDVMKNGVTANAIDA